MVHASRQVEASRLPGILCAFSNVIRRKQNSALIQTLLDPQVIVKNDRIDPDPQQAGAGFEKSRPPKKFSR
jgi:hypothetical protein